VSAFSAEVVVRRQRFANPESGFAVLDCEHEGDEIVLVGPLAHLEERERVAITGAWVDDPRFGPQVKVRDARPLAPAGEGALAAYLRRVRHVGPARAAQLLDRYGDAVLETIDADPRAAFRAAGLSPRKVSEAVRSWDGLRATRQLHLLLAPHGLAWLTWRVHKHYGDAAHRVVRERPYELTSIFGVGFHTADRIARAAGVGADSPERARAAVLHALAEAERDGSTCLPAGELARAAAGLLDGVAPDASLLAEMAQHGDLVVEVDAAGTAWCYRAPTAALEAELAARVAALLDARPSKRLAAPEGAAPEGAAPDRAAPEGAAPDRAGRPAGGAFAVGDLVPAPEQAAAVRAAFAHRLSIVTGGPGTGKTATIRMICAAAAEQDADVLLVAPTGRAARRVAESTGEPASTIHAALGWVPGDGPAHDEDAPLHGDVLVVDETSMANLELLVTLLRAVGPVMHVVLVGDADQLAPVGAGKPFAELVASGRVPVAALRHIFRQAAGSMIVQGAHAIRQGHTPSFAPDERMRRDLFLVEREAPAEALNEIVSLVATRLPAHYGVDPVEGIQVFAPVYKGPVGIDALNLRLREALNPGGEPVLGGRFRIGDKLMLSGRNLHELGLMNGTVLRLLDVRGDGEALIVSADGAIFTLPGEEAPRLGLAYACSVHKGQGIELPVAILVAHPAAGAFFLRREMLYTAITRAREATVVVGRREVVARAARTPDTARRHSRLVDRLREE
jgi:exodeoxyribonuclease V alpha subunit